MCRWSVLLAQQDIGILFIQNRIIGVRNPFVSRYAPKSYTNLARKEMSEQFFDRPQSALKLGHSNWNVIPPPNSKVMLLNMRRETELA